MKIITKRFKAIVTKNDENQVDFDLKDGETVLPGEELVDVDTTDQKELKKLVDGIRTNNLNVKRMVGLGKSAGQEVTLDLKFLVP